MQEPLAYYFVAKLQTPQSGGLVGSKLIEAYDEDGDGKIDWKEFKTIIAKMAKDID